MQSRSNSRSREMQVYQSSRLDMFMMQLSAKYRIKQQEEQWEVEMQNSSNSIRQHALVFSTMTLQMDLYIHNSAKISSKEPSTTHYNREIFPYSAKQMKFTTMDLALTAVKKLRILLTIIQTLSSLVNPQEKVYLIQLGIFKRTSLVKSVDAMGV